jgi:hypothetical protein
MKAPRRDFSRVVRSFGIESPSIGLRLPEKTRGRTFESARRIAAALPPSPRPVCSHSAARCRSRPSAAACRRGSTPLARTWTIRLPRGGPRVHSRPVRLRPIPSPSPRPSARRSIKHVVILMKENRSFDQLLGALNASGQAAVADVPASFANPDESRTAVAPFHFDTTCVGVNPGASLERDASAGRRRSDGRLREERRQVRTPTATRSTTRSAGRPPTPASAPFQDFLIAVADGTLPNVTFVDGLPNVEDEHPTADLQLGEAWTRKIYEAAVASPLWARAGDHLDVRRGGRVRRRGTAAELCLRRAPGEPAGRPILPAGVRVPLAVISPYAKPHFVSHVVQSTRRSRASSRWCSACRR